jgi:hypothetical protein
VAGDRLLGDRGTAGSAREDTKFFQERVTMIGKKPPQESADDYEIVEVNTVVRVVDIVSVRLKPEEMDMLTALAEACRLTLSEELRLDLRCLSDQPNSAADALGDRAGSTSCAGADVVFSANRDAWTISNS